MPRVAPEAPPEKVAPQGRRFRIRPRVWACLAILVGLGFASNLLWKRTAPIVERDPQYILSADRIQISTPPPWIRSDVRSQVLRDSAIAGSVSVLEDWDTLAKRVLLIEFSNQNRLQSFAHGVPHPPGSRQSSSYEG